jgi:hypothetical protein
MTDYPPHWINETTLPKNKRLIIDKDMVRSEAFCRLTGAAKHILLELHIRLKVDCLKNGRSTKDQRSYAQNNGKLKLTYRGITKMFGYAPKTISKAINRLCSNGFIEIVKVGVGVKRESAEIALIKNWRDFGTPNFRPGRGKAAKPVNGGFKKKTTIQSEAVPLHKVKQRGSKNAATTIQSEAVEQFYRFTK